MRFDVAPRPLALLLAVVTALLLGCSSTLSNAPPLTQNRELGLYATLAGYPGSHDMVVLTAASQFIASGREHDGLALFRRLAAEQPARPLFRSLQGTMQARTADDIALLERVAWVEEAIVHLDAGAAGDPFLGRYLRGMVFADLPERFGKTDQAIADLDAVLRQARRFPFAAERGVLAALARAWARKGDVVRAASFRAQAGGEEGPGPALLADASVSQAAGFRFEKPELHRETDGVWIAEGFDFSTIVFLVDVQGVVVIDAGTTERNARAAMAALRRVTSAPVKHVVFTHAHWDHVGGAAAVIEPGAEVWASHRFPAELARMRGAHNPFRTSFWGTDPIPLEVRVDRLVSAPETLRLGALELRLAPGPSGETDDALWIHDVGHRRLFVGDVFMPYVGAPFVAEGSTAGYIEAVAAAQRYDVARIIHGHPPLTRYWTKEAMPGLEQALRALRAHVLGAIGDARPLAEVLGDAFLPGSLHRSPHAAMPFAVMRDTFVQRAHREHSGYWSADGTGIDEFTSAEWAAALDLLGGKSAGAFGEAATELNRRGDAALALRVADLGLRAHPGDAALAAARAEALAALQARYQQINPFRFIIYSGWSGRDVPPVGARGGAQPGSLQQRTPSE